jgi:HTH-type transcriptional regulator/antitoxin HigA
MPHLLDPHELQSEAAYLAALDELDSLLATDPDTPAGHRFDELVTLIEAWEARHHTTPLTPCWPPDQRP